jgi:hypothetical protein
VVVVVVAGIVVVVVVAGIVVVVVVAGIVLVVVVAGIVLVVVVAGIVVVVVVGRTVVVVGRCVLPAGRAVDLANSRVALSWRPLFEFGRRVDFVDRCGAPTGGRNCGASDLIEIGAAVVVRPLPDVRAAVAGDPFDG